MGEDLYYVMKNLPGVIAFIGVILTLLTVVLEMTGSSVKNVIKSDLGKFSTSKVVLGIMIFFVIMFFSEIVFINSNVSNELVLDFFICIGVIIFYGVIMLIVHRELKKTEKLVFSMEKAVKDLPNKNSMMLAVANLSMIFIGIIDVISYLVISNNDVITRTGGCELILLQTVVACTAISKISYTATLQKLKKYIIKSDQFEDGHVIALIISETNDEILIKCDYTYPIAFPKSKIDAYIDVSKLSDDEIKNILGKNIDGKYNGYYLSKE